MNYKVLTVLGCFLLSILFAPGIYADYYESDLLREQAQIDEIQDRQKKEEERGYRYGSYQRDKDLIFRQMEVITGDEETRYIIVPGDTLSITYVDKDERIVALYIVSAEGEIFLPLAGAVKVGGLSKQQARALINEKLQRYIRYPNVDLTVNATGRIMVLGEVNLPGVYFMQPDLTVMEAIMKAGGYDKDDARLKSVMLLRGGPGNPQVIRLNLHKMITKGDRSDDLMIKPGDMVYVPKTFIADLIKFKDEVYKWVSTYYSYGRLPVSPPVTPGQPVLYDR